MSSQPTSKNTAATLYAQVERIAGGEEAQVRALRDLVRVFWDLAEAQPAGNARWASSVAFELEQRLDRWEDDRLQESIAQAERDYQRQVLNEDDVPFPGGKLDYDDDPSEVGFDPYAGQYLEDE